MHNMNSNVPRSITAFKATSLTRSALVLCELGSAGAASHHGRLSDGAQCLAVCTCVQQQPALHWCSLYTHPLYVRGTSGWEQGYLQNWMRWEPTCPLHPPYTPPSLWQLGNVPTSPDGAWVAPFPMTLVVKFRLLHTLEDMSQQTVM